MTEEARKFTVNLTELMVNHNTLLDEKHMILIDELHGFSLYRKIPGGWKLMKTIPSKFKVEFKRLKESYEEA